jgi:hypothetical protein
MNGNNPTTTRDLGADARTTAQKASRDAGNAAQHAAQQVKQEASRATEKAKTQAQGVKQEVTSSIHQATDHVKATGRDYANRKKAQAAAELSIFRDAIMQAADKLKKEDHETVGCYVEAAAEQIDRLRQTLEQRSVQSVLSDAQAITRRHPEVVYGGLFVAGVALMRFLKASHRDGDEIMARRTRMGDPSRQYRDARYRPGQSVYRSGQRPPTPGLSPGQLGTVHGGDSTASVDTIGVTTEGVLDRPIASKHTAPNQNS